MSRSGYSNDGDSDQWSLIMYRGAVNSAIKGARGQQFLRELLLALDALPAKRLIEGTLETAGEFCALGAIGRAKGFDLTKIDTYDAGAVSNKFNIAESMAREIMYMNDDSISAWDWVQVPGTGWVRKELKNIPERRWAAVRAWVVASIVDPDKPAGAPPA